MATTQYENVSPDLIWACVNGRGSQLVKTRRAGGQQFSRDPYNLVNRHCRKHEGFVNPSAISIQRPYPNPDNTGGNGLIFTTKKPSKTNKPAQGSVVTTFGPNTPARKAYRSIATQTAKRGYRADLRGEAVARASAIKLSQKEKKAARPPKPRGAAAARKKREEEGA